MVGSTQFLSTRIPHLIPHMGDVAYPIDLLYSLQL